MKPDDVLLKVGSYPIASDGTILFEGNRLSAGMAFQQYQNGEDAPLVIWRDGHETNVSLPMKIYEADRATGSQYDKLPRYFVYGGLVFTPLTMDYLKTLPGSPSESPNSELLYELFYRRYESPKTVRPEPIVMASVLADVVNANVAARGRGLVDTVNGIRIEKLEDVIRAVETTTNAYDRVQFLPLGNFECLDRAEVAKAKERILKTYNIVSDRRL